MIPPRASLAFLLCLPFLAPALAAQPAAPAVEAKAPAKKAKPQPRKPARRKPARAPRKAAPAQKVKPAVKVPQQAKAAPAAPAEPAAVKPAAAPLGSLAELGAMLRDGEEAAEVVAVLPGSQAAQAGLLPGDRLASLGGAPVRTRAEARAAWLAWDPALRLWAVVRRGLRVLDLGGGEPAREPAFARGPKSLSPRESVLQEALLERSARGAEALRAAAPALPVTVPARQVIWVRFPDGLPDTVATGDILEAEVTMAVASDAGLDFLCIPPRSALWGKVLQTSATEGVRAVRIHFYKAALAGGHTVPVSARVVDAAGQQGLLKVSPGGTLVMAEPVLPEGQKRRRGSRILEPDVRLRLELDSPMTVTEPPQFYPAGAGLWIKTKEAETGRVFEVTHVIAGRSAEKAGVRVGDLITAIAGKPTARMDFGEALALLYGAPGSLFKVTVLKPGLTKADAYELKRGIYYKEGVETAVPLPFEKKEKARP